MKTFFAFTLAETLIVMGIIGIVAALTIPNLTQSTGEKEKVAKLQKIYSNLNDAFGRATAVYGPITEWSGGNSDVTIRFADRITEFTKITKNCGVKTYSGCFTKDLPKWLNGSDGDVVVDGGNVILADGSSVGFEFTTQSCNNNIDSCGFIFVDIDGPNKGPFTYGKDVFRFFIKKDGIYPLGGSEMSTSCYNQGDYCTGWVIQNGNMDYLKVDSSGKCPNGTILSSTNTTCK